MCALNGESSLTGGLVFRIILLYMVFQRTRIEHNLFYVFISRKRATYMLLCLLRSYLLRNTNGSNMIILGEHYTQQVGYRQPVTLNYLITLIPFLEYRASGPVSMGGSGSFHVAQDSGVIPGHKKLMLPGNTAML